MWKCFNIFITFILFVGVWKLEDNLHETIHFFFSIMWFPAIQLWSSGLVANAFTHWVILLASNRNYWVKRNRWNEYRALEVKCRCPWWSGRGREWREHWGGDDQIRALRRRWQICRLQTGSLAQVCDSVLREQQAMRWQCLLRLLKFHKGQSMR